MFNLPEKCQFCLLFTHPHVISNHFTCFFCVTAACHSASFCVLQMKGKSYMFEITRQWVLYSCLTHGMQSMHTRDFYVFAGIECRLVSKFCLYSVSGIFSVVCRPFCAMHLKRWWLETARMRKCLLTSSRTDRVKLYNSTITNGYSLFVLVWCKCEMATLIYLLF